MAGQFNISGSPSPQRGADDIDSFTGVASPTPSQRNTAPHDPLADLFEGGVQTVADSPHPASRGGMLDKIRAERAQPAPQAQGDDPLADILPPVRGSLEDAAVQVPAGFNRGLNSMISIPGSIVAWGAEKLGVAPKTADKLRWKNNPVSNVLDNPDFHPQTMAGRYVGAATEAVGASAIPSAAIMKVAPAIAAGAPTQAQLGRALPGAIRQTAEGIAAAPGVAAGLDVASGLASGVSQQAARDLDLGPGWEAAAGLVGGMGPAAAYGIRNPVPHTGPQPTLGTPMGQNLASQRAREAATDLAAFNELGVRPFGPSFSTPAGRSVAKQLSETPLIGSPVANALDESLVGARDAARRLADSMAPNATYENAGQTLQRGLERFRTAGVRGIEADTLESMGIPAYGPVQTPTPMSTQAAQRITQAVQDRVAMGLPAQGTATTSRGVQVPASRPLSQTYLTRRGAADLDTNELHTLIATPPSQTSFATRQEALYESAERARPSLFRSNGSADPGMLSPTNTREALGAIQSQLENQIAGQGVIRGALADRLMNARSTLTMDNLRAIRTEVGRSLSNYGVADASLDRTQLKSLYAAISRDLETGYVDLAARAWRNARDAGNPADLVRTAQQADGALFQFRRADRYTPIAIPGRAWSIWTASRPCLRRRRPRQRHASSCQPRSTMVAAISG